MKTFNNIYVGIVVQNNDPEKRGRIKIFVPENSPSVKEDWNSSHVDQNISDLSGDIEKILPRLKIILPWAEPSSPLLSTGTDYKYKVDSNNIKDTNNIEYPYEKTDEWNNVFKVKNYGSKTKGSFNIPSVGSHVILFYREGNPLYPIYIGQVYNKNDWNGVFESNEYPNGYSNNSKTDDNYQQKFILNRDGGMIEIVDTKDAESFRLEGKDTSAIYFDKNGINEFTPNNFNRLVFKNLYSTIKKNYYSRIGDNRSENIGIDSDITIGKNYNETVGPVNSADSYVIESNNVSIINDILLNVTDESVNETYDKITSISATSLSGNKTVNIGSEWNITVGSGGISIKTTGKKFIDAPIQEYTSKYFSIYASDGLNLDGGTYTKITGTNILLTGQTVISGNLTTDGNIKSSKNVGIGGELFLQHITAPTEYQVTEETKIKAPSGKWKIVGASLTSDQGPLTNVMLVGGTLTIDQPHTHQFKNLPLSLSNSSSVYGELNNMVTKISKDINSTKQDIEYNG